jgi:hypothetical protein
MTPFTTLKTTVNILTGRSRKEYAEAVRKSIQEEQDEINRRGHA